MDIEHDSDLDRPAVRQPPRKDFKVMRRVQRFEQRLLQHQSRRELSAQSAQAAQATNQRQPPQSTSSSSATNRTSRRSASTPARDASGGPGPPRGPPGRGPPGRSLRRRNTLRQSFRRARGLTNDMARHLSRTPKWLKVARQVYHKYGGKHVMLLMILSLYTIIGGAIFFAIEKKAADEQESEWRKNITNNRTDHMTKLIKATFNNSNTFIMIDNEQTQRMKRIMNDSFAAYETRLKIKFSKQQIDWDLWTAMLYASTICTTIGYGHLYPISNLGKVVTMIYAIFGIPLVLSILDDLGKVLTVVLKYPWMLIKMMCRRLFRHCTMQTDEEIKRLDELDREGLAIFDLPIPVAIAVVLLWIFICSATFCIWETEWTYFTAFYFFFISLSTIGLGDITPQSPRMMLVMFFYMIIGLSLVSMCINLIQIQLERTYEKGKEDIRLQDDFATWSEIRLTERRNSLQKRKKTILGVIQSDSNYSMSLSRQESRSQSSRSQSSLPSKASKTVQTMISFPSPKHTRSGYPAMGTKMIPTSCSIDDVMKLVNTDENELFILSEIADRIQEDALTSVRNVNAHIDNLPPIDEEDRSLDPSIDRSPAEQRRRFFSKNQPSTSHVGPGILKSFVASSFIAGPAEVSFRSPLASEVPTTPDGAPPPAKPHRAVKLDKKSGERQSDSSPVRRFGRTRDSSEETLSLIENDKLQNY